MKNLVEIINEAATPKSIECKLGPFICSVALIFPKKTVYNKAQLKTSLKGIDIWSEPQKWSDSFKDNVIDEIVEFITTNWDHRQY